VDRLLSGVESGPVTDSQPRAARIRAEQASKATRFFLKFLRDILSTSFIDRQATCTKATRVPLADSLVVRAGSVALAV